MRKLLFFFFLCPVFLQAQDPVRYQIEPHSRILKFSHLSLLDPHSSIQFAFEHQLGEKTSLQHELGYMTRILYANEDIKKTRGWRLRNEFRIYLEAEGRNLEGPYFAPEFLFIHLEYDKNEPFGKGCVSPWNCNYYQYMDFTIQKRVYGVHPKLGYQLVYRSFVLDAYGGLGFRHVRIKNINEPPNGMHDGDFFDFRKREGIYNLPSLSLGFKIGYVLFNRQRKLDQYQPR